MSFKKLNIDPKAKDESMYRLVERVASARGQNVNYRFKDAAQDLAQAKGIPFPYWLPRWAVVLIITLLSCPVVYQSIEKQSIFLGILSVYIIYSLSVMNFSLVGVRLWFGWEEAHELDMPVNKLLMRVNPNIKTWML